MPAAAALPPTSSRASRAESTFSETEAWAGVQSGWQHLHGSFRNLGYSIEWHDFTSAYDLDWSRSFHPHGVELCLNLAGHGVVQAGAAKLELAPLTAGFYLQSEPRLTGTRAAGERHQFVTVELSFAFLAKHLTPGEEGLNARLKNILKGKPVAQVSETFRMTADHQQMIASLRSPPVYAAAQRLWYHAKALEVAAALFY